MQRGAGGSGDNVHLTLCVEKSICESSLKEKRTFGKKIKGLAHLKSLEILQDEITCRLSNCINCFPENGHLLSQPGKLVSAIKFKPLESVITTT